MLADKLKVTRRQEGKIYCCQWPDTGVCTCIEALKDHFLVESQSKKIEELEAKLNGLAERAGR